MRTLIVGLLTVGATLGALPGRSAEKKNDLPGDDIKEKYSLVYSTDFEEGAHEWEPMDKENWSLVASDEGQIYRLGSRSTYDPVVKSPRSRSVLKDIVVSDFVFEVKVKSRDKEDGAHQDMIVFFGYRGPTKFYYVHLGMKTDSKSNQIHLVNDAPRRPISKHTSKENPGTNWDHNWHQVKVIRNGALIQVYFDDMAKPCMAVEDETFLSGGFGIGSFNNFGDWDDIKIWGHKVEE